MTVLLLGATVYISTLLSSPNGSPTQIQKTKAAAVSYTKTIDLQNDFGAVTPTTDPSVTGTVTPTVTAGPTNVPTTTNVPTAAPTLIALAATLTPSPVPTSRLTPVVTLVPTDVPQPSATPTLQPLLAYKSTSISPTLIPVNGNTGGMNTPTATHVPSPTKKVQPTAIQQLPDTGWVQTSSILFIVATTTIFFSLIF